VKIACYRTDGRGAAHIGVVDEVAGTIQRIATEAPVDQVGVLAAIEADLRLSDAVPLDSVTLLAPVPRPPRNVFCIGKNYREHVAEFAGSGYDTSASTEVPEHPIVFTKPPSAVVGPDMDVDPHTALTRELDYEGELAVVIGRGGRGIGRDDAMAHVWGYTIVNDITARDLQHRHRQWFLGKGLDTTCPMGPWVVTADEIDVSHLEVRTTVNGELRQHGRVSDLIFDIPTLIETLSAGITLEPGDIISTGTPAGVGIGFDPPRFLQPGDVVAITIHAIGTLTNRVGSSAAPSS
jgi:2-keto-4-pentenoate hydratase/2-oxohepta-3-ene-1,7-dioic acid hydratase in catechol pathway